jgi:hypothetical protein
MIHALHLLWMLPVSGMIGFMIAALMVAAKDHK